MMPPSLILLFRTVQLCYEKLHIFIESMEMIEGHVRLIIIILLLLRLIAKVIL